METYFASAAKSDGTQLKLEIETVSHNPVINGLLDVVVGVLAVLNQHRQIIALNEALMAMLGIENATEVLGLRPGEAFECIHANEMPGGCGTSKFCSTCGAAVAIVTSLGTDSSVEKRCALTVMKNGKNVELYLSVRSHPITFNGERLLLLFIQDISQLQQWATLERLFFHDINNILMGLVGTSELLTIRAGEQPDKLATSLHLLAVRLAQEVKLQQYLINMNMLDYQSIFHNVSSRQIFDELEQMYSNHPAAEDKILKFPRQVTEVHFKTDMNLLIRVLSNMITNALEATRQHETVKVWLERTTSSIIFYVWNKHLIPASVAERIFQRNFSTKQEIGRGLGTYSMKLFGENFLGGKVEFSSSIKNGTTFWFELPV